MNHNPSPLNCDFCPNEIANSPGSSLKLLHPFYDMINLPNVNRKNSELEKVTNLGCNFWRGCRKCVRIWGTSARRLVYKSKIALQCIVNKPLLCRACLDVCVVGCGGIRKRDCFARTRNLLAWSRALWGAWINLANWETLRYDRSEKEAKG